MKKRNFILSLFTLLIFSSINVWATYLHKFETIEGFTKVLIKADTVNQLFLKPIKYGFLNSDNALVFEIECEYVGNFHHGIAKVKKNEKFGFINKKGEFIIEAKYLTVGDFAEDMVAVGDSSHQLDKIIDINSNVVGKFDKKIILSNKVSGEGIQNGLVLITEDNYSYKFSEGLINIENKFYDKTGKFKFNIPGNSKDCKNGMVVFSVSVTENGDPKYGYCNCQGKPLIAPQYDAADDFSIDRAVVGKKGKGYKFFEINKQGKILRFIAHK
jgi:hypothetical protein